MITVTKRASPVKVTLPPSPWFVPSPNNDEEQGTSAVVRATRFRSRQPGFGSRHIYDDAPFTLWDTSRSVFRELHDSETKWIAERYKARRILVNLPDIFIQTSSPPIPIPLTIAAAVVRFYPLDIELHTTIPQGILVPYGTTQRQDILSYPLPLYAIPTHMQCLEVIERLKAEVSIRSVHFLPPVIIVEIQAHDGRKYDRKTLPAKAGGLNLMYHHSQEAFWGGQSQLSYARLTTPSHHVSDYADYLRQTPFQLSPGVCLGSATESANASFSSTWQATTAGVMVQRGSERRLTAANHGFKASCEVFHPSPSGRRIGEIVNRWPAWDLAFVAVDPSISFDNGRYFSAPPPTRLVAAQELMAGDWFELDGISTGRIDMMARGRMYDRPHLDSTTQSTVPVNYTEWDVSTLYSTFGAMGGLIQHGVCGAPAVDVDGRVAGFFRFLDGSGMWASTASLEFLILQGWSIV